MYYKINYEIRIILCKSLKKTIILFMKKLYLFITDNIIYKKRYNSLIIKDMLLVSKNFIICV